MKYFTKITSSYAPKNKLHKELHKSTGTMNRLLVDQKDVLEFVDKLRITVEKACEKHPNCKPVTYDVYKPSITYDEHDYLLVLSDVVSITLYKIKGEVEFQ